MHLHTSTEVSYCDLSLGDWDLKPRGGGWVDILALEALDLALGRDRAVGQLTVAD